MQTVTILRGIQGSGKTTERKKITNKNHNVVPVSRDDIREMVFGGKYRQNFDDETLITSIEHNLIQSSLKAGKDLLIDACNIRPKYLRQLFEVVYAVKNRSEVKFNVIDLGGVPLETCLYRNRNRERIVPDNVIKRFHNSMQSSREQWYKIYDEYTSQIEKISHLKQDKSLPKAIVYDMDGTLALMKDMRTPFEWDKVQLDNINTPVFNDLLARKNAGYKIIIATARDGAAKQGTLEWLQKYNVPYDELYIKGVNDNRKDSIVKTEFWNDMVKKYYLECLVDDRNQVVIQARKLGLTVFQVADGNF